MHRRLLGREPNTAAMSERLPPRRASRALDTIAPDGSEIRLIADRDQGATRASLCEVRLPRGAVTRPISHHSVEEIWYVLEGRGHVWRSPPGGSGDTVDVAPGDALVIPTGWRFQFSADDDELRFLCYTSPPWPGPEEAEPAASGGLGTPTV